ncbi:hypothetical protein ACFWPA_16260 [Rhodococcus sp. NPDC058505]|uniref:hypothetical protein n=1 Tax=unclassified Rhodococcus (in: high G+C Gram-positive bacteria) TaxID=192944 RepID=UPI003668BBAB
MTTARSTVAFLAALLTAAAAGWALMTPLAATFGVAGSEGQIRALLTSRSLAAAVGLLVAVAAAGALSRRGSVRTARLAALLGLGLSVAVLVVNSDARQVEWLIAATYVAGIGAGLALGGAVVAATGRAEEVAVTGGALAAFLLVPYATARLDLPMTVGWTAYAPLTDAGNAVDPAPWWLVLPAAVATLFALLLGGGRAARPSTRGGTVTLAVVLAALVTNAAIGATQDNRTVTWVLLGAFVTVVIGAAFLLDGQDGTLLLTTTAIVAAAAGTLPGTSDLTWVGVAILAVGVTVGVVAGVRWPGVVVGLTLLAAVCLIGVLPDVADGLGDVLRSFALAPVAGYAVGSCVGARSGATVAGLAVLFVPSALTVAGQASESGLLGAQSPFTELPRGALATAPPDLPAVALAMTLVTLTLVAAVGALRQRTEDR